MEMRSGPKVSGRSRWVVVKRGSTVVDDFKEKSCAVSSSQKLAEQIASTVSSEGHC